MFVLAINPFFFHFSNDAQVNEFVLSAYRFEISSPFVAFAYRLLFFHVSIVFFFSQTRSNSSFQNHFRMQMSFMHFCTRAIHVADKCT